MKVKLEPGATGLSKAVKSSHPKETPCYRFCNRSSSFCRVGESLELRHADNMWKCFLGGLNHFEEGPEFGSAYLVAFVVESLESKYKTSLASQRINFLQIQTIYDVIRNLRQAFLLLQISKDSKFEDQTSLMAIFEQCLKHAKEHDDLLPGPLTQMQAEFTRDEDNLKLIGELKKDTSRICGWLELTEGTIQVVEVNSKLPSSLVIKFEPPPQCSDVYTSILREKALPSYIDRKSRASETMTAKMNRLCFEILPSVADCTPVAHSGDKFMHLVGPPTVRNHFFMIVMTKTTDGIATFRSRRPSVS